MPEATRVGGEILVNATTANGQGEPTALLLSNGHYAVAWIDTSGGGQTVTARILGANGVPLTGDIAVSQGNDANEVRIVALAGGGFMAAWDDFTGANPDVHARIFGSDGQPVGTEFIVNSTLAGQQIGLEFTPLHDGRILATWSDFDGTTFRTKTQFFAADGTRIGSEFQTQIAAPVELSDGGFAMVYSSATDATHHNVFVQLADSNLQAHGSPISVAFDASGQHLDPVIKALPGGGFVVAWASNSDPGFGDNVVQIDGQVFAAGGSPVSAVFHVNSHPTAANAEGIAGDPVVQTFADGRFLIAWADSSHTITDLDAHAIYAQLYDPAGTPIGGEFQINTETRLNQFEPSITADANGTFLVSWFDTGSNDGDVKAQLLDLPQRQLFDDAANHVDFNLVHPSDFAGPYNNAGNGDDVVQLPNASGDVATWGIAHGFIGGAGNDTLTEGAAFAPLLGGAGDDILTGNAGPDVLSGGDGNDTLIGLGGGDELNGGPGNDTYVVGSASDTIVEAAGDGIDTVQTSLLVYALRDNVENLTFVGSGGFTGVGNALDNVITGGTSTPSELNGGAGNDTYVVSVLGDTLVEVAGGGIDTVRTTLSSYALRDNIENLTFVGTGSFSGSGNALDNVITSGTGAASELVGGAGNDTYVISVAGDTIVEQPGGGIDTVQTSLSFYQLPAEVENLTYTGTGSFTGIGNALDNVITGGPAGDDYLYAGAGADTLVGGAGADVFLFDQPVNGIDTIGDFASGSDRIFLNGAVFTHTASFNLVQGSGALTAPNGNSTIFYHGDTGQLGYDADGSGAGAEIIFATVGAGKTLISSDFHFY